MTSLDGRRFRMESSTASAVDEQAPTVFEYHEDESVVWGEYSGDTVTVGRFVGLRRGDYIDVTFAHALVAGGKAVSGSSTSRIERDDDGRLRLIEDFEIDGVPHVSVCTEDRL